MGDTLTHSSSLFMSELAGHPKAGIFNMWGSSECVKIASEIFQNWSIFTASLGIAHKRQTSCQAWTFYSVTEQQISDNLAEGCCKS